MVMKGRPLAKAGYEQELASIKGFIAMQNKADSSGISATAADKVNSSFFSSDLFMFLFFFLLFVSVFAQDELKPEDLVGPRLLKKKKAKDVSVSCKVCLSCSNFCQGSFLTSRDKFVFVFVFSISKINSPWQNLPNSPDFTGFRQILKSYINSLALQLHF